MKYLSLILTFVLVLYALCGCTAEESMDFTISQYDSVSRIEIELDKPSDTVSDENSNASEQSQDITSASTDNNPSDGETTGSILVKDKKYTFEGNDLVILDVTNETNQDLSITINGNYLDKDGNVLKTESQTFDQFSVGYRKYFLFHPEIGFDKFTYSVDAKKSIGPFYAKDLSFSFGGLVEGKMSITEQELQGDYKLYPTLVAEYSFELKGATELKPEGDFVLFNDKNEIVMISPLGGAILPGEKNYKCTILCQTTESKLNRPTQFQGEFKAIYILHEIAPTKR